MTATLKVLLRRFVWQRRKNVAGSVPITEETFSEQNALPPAKLATSTAK